MPRLTRAHPLDKVTDLLSTECFTSMKRIYTDKPGEFSATLNSIGDHDEILTKYIRVP